MPTPRNQSGRQTQAGFTMVELLVVITVIAILAGLLMPAVIGAMRKAHETKTLNLIHQCETAALTYYNDYGDYPPSTWAELGLSVVLPNETTNPSTLNESIKVFTACLASRNGGPYLEFSNDMLGNTDEDIDGDLDSDGTDDVLQHTNYYFGGTQVFEIVDFWGNPLVYVHDRDYMAHDGWNGDPDDEDGDGDPVDPTEFQVPPTTPPAWAIGDPLDPSWVGSEAVPYIDSEGNLRPCYARSPRGFLTGNYPNLDSFQLFSWGPDLMPGCAESVTTPGTPNPSEPGIWPGWDKNSRNLTNWQE